MVFMLLNNTYDGSLHYHYYKKFNTVYVYEVIKKL